MHDIVYGNESITQSQHHVWQNQVVHLLNRVEIWLQKAHLIQPIHQAWLKRMRVEIENDHLRIAFIAEFSRGKSELINALFFSDYGARILPAASGRTTMCPTELLYDPHKPSYIKLLPIQTYEHLAGTEEFLDHDDAWVTIPLQPDHHDFLASFEYLRQTIEVPPEQAQEYGLYDPDNADHQNYLGSNGLVEISRWRHATINVPHTLLKEGWVILDTPGLNAIGSEPELALRLIPSAHMVVFLLAADTGVTKSDLDLWMSHVQPHQKHHAIVVLNKIDTLWDPLKNEEEHQHEIKKQIEDTAKYLQVNIEQIYPISAKQGLIAKMHQNQEMYQQSGLAFLEQTLKAQLTPKRKALLMDKICVDFQLILDSVDKNLVHKKEFILEQLDQLQQIQKKDPQALSHYHQRLRLEREEFESVLIYIQTLRLSFSEHGNHILDITQASNLQNIKQSCTENNTPPHEGIDKINQEAQHILEKTKESAESIFKVLNNIIDYMNDEFNIHMIATNYFNFAIHESHYQDIQKIYQRQTHYFDFVKKDKWQVQQRFFETMASRLKNWLQGMHQDIELWMKNMIQMMDNEIDQQQKNIEEKLQMMENAWKHSASADNYLKKLQNDLQELEKNRMQLGYYQTEFGFLNDACQH